jgi:hypothetical protein
VLDRVTVDEIIETGPARHGPTYPADVPERRTLAEIEQAMFAHVASLQVDLPAAKAVWALDPAFNAAESEADACLWTVTDLTRSLRLLVTSLDADPEQRVKPARGA